MTLINKTVEVSDITVGARVRQDLGDLAALADSIGRRGLLNPLTLSPTGEILAGLRRLEAIKLLGWEQVEVRIAIDVADLRDAVAIESDENTCRKEFSPTEAVNMARRIEAMEKPKAQQRQSRPGQARSAKSAERSPRPREAAAAATNLSHETLRKAGKVVDAASDPAVPEEVRQAAQAAQQQMDDSGNVEAAYRATQEAIAKAVADEKPELVDHQSARDVAKAVRAFKNAVKDIDPSRAALGARDGAHVDLHIEVVDGVFEWLHTYRRGLSPLSLVKEA